MNNLKLNKLNHISEEMKNAVKGGEAPCCLCGCCYANSGGSSIESNGSANYDLGGGMPNHPSSKICDTAIDDWIIVC